jgi:hypothetical protein
VEDERIIDDNIETIKRFSGVSVLAVMPFSESVVDTLHLLDPVVEAVS